MNLIRRVISSPQYLPPSQPPPKSLFLLPCTITIQQFSPFSTTAITNSLKSQQPKKSKKPKSPPPTNWSQTVKKQALTWPRPSEIMYQSKNSNFVNLIGKIEMPIQFHATPDGRHVAMTLVGQKDCVSSDNYSDSLVGKNDCIFNGGFSDSLVVPVVFEGDLAHIVACHVKVNDFVYVCGKLSLEPFPFDLSGSEGKFYVIGNELNFVQGLAMQGSNKNVVANDDFVEERIANIKSSVDKGTVVDKKEWEEFLVEPDQWSVVTSQDDVLKGAIDGVERKVDGKRLDLDSSTPLWVYKKLEELSVENKTEEMKLDQLDTRSRSEEMKIEPLNIEKKIEMKIGPLNTEKKGFSNVGGTPKDADSVLNSWRDLVKNPMDWRDYREKKSSGSFKANYPDFKHKTKGTALWLNNAPNWVLTGLAGLAGLDVDAQVQVSNLQRAKGGKGKNEDNWKSLVDNPDKWWDNRSRKTNLKAPDFKHKETGEALWLNSSPEWALNQLPPLKNEHSFAAGNKNAFVA